MERYKRRFSIDAPQPYTAVRRHSEPVTFNNPELPQNYKPSRKYSNTFNTPSMNLMRSGVVGEPSQRKFSTNDQVRRLSMNIAIQEALNEEYGYSPIFKIPLVYTPPPEKLYVSECTLQLKISSKKSQ